MMKAQFMSLWDGLDTDYHCQVLTVCYCLLPSDCLSLTVCLYLSGDHHGSHQSSSGPGLGHPEADAHQVPHQPACKATPTFRQDAAGHHWSSLITCDPVLLVQSSRQREQILRLILENESVSLSPWNRPVRVTSLRPGRGHIRTNSDLNFILLTVQFPHCKKL